MVKKSLSRIYLAIIFLFLYLPIGVLIVLSFNNSLSRVKWGGFTTEWYRNLVSDPTIMNAFYTTILITVASSVIATIIGTMAAIGISAMRKRNRQIMLGATNIPLLNADIVTGISLMLLFVRFTALGTSTVLIAHITFDIPYVILNVLPKLSNTSSHTYEAARDLGATPQNCMAGYQAWCILRFSDGCDNVLRRFFHHLLYQRCRCQHIVYHDLYPAA